MAPMTRQLSPGSIPGEDVAADYSRRAAAGRGPGVTHGAIPGEDVAAYCARRAAAGTGLIITEGAFIDHRSAGFSDGVPRFHGEQQLAGWSRVVEAVHAHSGKIMPQIWHVGIQRPA